MTALTISTDIPTNINTLEKLAAWLGLALARVNPTLKILESPDAEPQRVGQCALIKADDGSTRLIVRLSIPISEDYATNTVKFWQTAAELSNTALPTAFKSN
ncbi:MAG: hypothetical protein ACRCVX_11690 [Shewanella sp.]